MNTIDKINTILAKNKINVKLNKTHLDQNMKQLGIDSITVMSIIVQIEDELGITLDNDKLINLKTVQDLIDAIDSIDKTK